MQGWSNRGDVVSVFWDCVKSRAATFWTDCRRWIDFWVRPRIKSLESEQHQPASREQVELLRVALNSSWGKGLTQWRNYITQRKPFLSLSNRARLGSFIQRGNMVPGEGASRWSLPSPFIDSEQTLTIVSLDFCAYICRICVCVCVLFAFVSTNRYPVSLYVQDR